MDFTLLENLIKEKKITIAVFGLGRIGLPTAIEFANGGHHVIGYDISKKTLENLKQKKTFVDEPGIPELLNDVVDKKLIEFSEDFGYAVKNSNVIICCVPTPVNDDKNPDYSAIKDVSEKIGSLLTKNQIIIYESSVSPTTIETFVIPILEKKSNFKINQDFGVCACPERADPGSIFKNWNKVSRIVGGSSKEVGATIVKLYNSVTSAKIQQVNSPGTANAVKLTENIFRDVNIALMNELAILYERLGIDAKEVIDGAATKYNFVPHYPGPGVGGPCLPANPYYIIKDAVKVDYIPFLIRVAREVNDRMPKHVEDLIIDSLNFCGKCLGKSIITILGLSYKANVRDIQISPAIKVVNFLLERKAKLQIWDPYYRGEKIDSFNVENSLEESIKNSDCIVLLTDHNEFKDLDFNKLETLSKKPLILVDSRNIYNINSLPKGLVYCGVGRKLRIIE